MYNILKSPMHKSIAFIEKDSGDPERRFSYDIFWNGQKIGYFETQIDYINIDTGERAYTVYEMKLNKGYRRKGIGSMILRKCEALAQDLNLYKVICKVETIDEETTNDDLEKFYLKNGYQLTTDLDDSHDLFALKVLKNEKR